jgi:sugar/nucleoside kinase (ribokinase family)
MAQHDQLAQYDYMVTVIGHIAVDVISDLDVSEVKISDGKFSDYNRKIRNEIGGTGVVLALASQKLGCRTAVVGKVGSDVQGDFIRSKLDREGILPLLAVDENVETGTVVMIYLQGDQRIILGSRGANAHLTAKDFGTEAMQYLCSSDLLFVSGYTLLDSKPREAVYQITKIAHEAHTFVAFDIVPHTLYQLLTFEQLIHYTAYADAVTLELNTARRFLGLADRVRQPFDNKEIDLISAKLLNYYQLVILNVSNDEQFVIDRFHVGSQTIRYTRYSQAEDKRAFLDKLFVSRVCEYIWAKGIR